MDDASSKDGVTVTTAFRMQLAEWGPGSQRDPLDAAEAAAYCRTLATSHYENFPLASWLLPKRLHQHFFNIYAYCRWSDDLADEVLDADESLRLLDWWRSQLVACFRGDATHPVFVALLPTIQEFDIPPDPFHHLLNAFEQDQRIREYQTFDELRDYCRGSADPVGRLVLHLCRQFNEQNVAWSDSICTGLQLANFWQDVSRDADIHRVYLPREDRERFGYTDDDLAARVTNAAFFDLMRFEVERAREWLRGGLPLIGRLPGRMQVDIELFARGGLKILERIEDFGFRVWETRPVVTKFDAARLLIGCVLRAFG
ncbi:MAG: squalene synthase HpnC, partial [Planctomycetota bacterium]|nr:squalene synthase HpnC [Planctomycetota bacterium]